MSFYIQGYTGNHSILSVAKTKAVAEKLASEKYNYIFLSKDCTYININNMRYDVSVPKFDIDVLAEFDVIEVLENGIADIIYQSTSKDNAIVVTMGCNSNCVMCPCSEKSRKYGFISSIERLSEILKYTPKTAEHITITGGEPCLLKEDMFKFMAILQREFFNTDFLLLTNGRAFSINEFTYQFIKNKPNKMKVAIPIYGYNAESHDSITQTKGSFEQMVKGIHNLLSYKMDIEVRIVISKLNINLMQEIADFIVRNFKGIVVVHFMAIEMLGNAAKNSDLVWIPYEDIFDYIRKPIVTIIKAGIDVELYNFPLCTVQQDFWGLCKKSISEYKVKYTEECNKCKVKSLCGGMFDSTMNFCHFKPKPITAGQ